jgi:hypothetical protein
MDPTEVGMVGVLMALFVIEVGLFGASSPGHQLLARAECALASMSGAAAPPRAGSGRCPCGEICDDDVRDDDVEDRDALDHDACDGCDRPDPDDPDDEEGE